MLNLPAYNMRNHDHFITTVFLERIDDCIVAVCDVRHRDKLGAVVYRPDAPKGGMRTVKGEYLAKRVPVLCKPVNVTICETSNVDAFTDIVTEYMSDGMKAVSSPIYTNDGFLKFVKRKRRCCDIIVSCNMDKSDSELDAIASILQVMIEGSDLKHVDTSIRRMVYMPLASQSERVMELVETLLKEFKCDKSVKRCLDETLSSILSNYFYMVDEDAYRGRLSVVRF